MKGTGGRWAAAILTAAILAAAAWAGRLPPEARPADGSAQLAERKLIALTFDDGPKPSTTPRLLDGLAERGVRATFFLIGCQVEDNAALVRRMDEEGHQIGIHTFDHVQLTDLNRRDFDAQVEATRALLKQVLGHNDFLLRPPYGKWDEGTRTMAGCPLILWSIDPEDWSDSDTARVVEAVVSQARDGGIILLHDIFDSSVDAALEIVDRLHAQGYYFCTIDQLFAERGTALEPGQVYWNAYP